MTSQMLVSSPSTKTCIYFGGQVGFAMDDRKDVTNPACCFGVISVVLFSKLRAVKSIDILYGNGRIRTIHIGSSP